MKDAVEVTKQIYSLFEESEEIGFLVKEISLPEKNRINGEVYNIIKKLINYYDFRDPRDIL